MVMDFLQEPAYQYLLIFKRFFSRTSRPIVLDFYKDQQTNICGFVKDFFQEPTLLDF